MTLPWDLQPKVCRLLQDLTTVATHWRDPLLLSSDSGTSEQPVLVLEPTRVLAFE